MKSILIYPLIFCRVICNKSRLALYVIPLLFTAAIVIPVFLLELDVRVFGENGFVEKVLNYFEILPGFYVAALAAVATFNRNAMDTLVDKAPNKCPKIIFPNEVEPTLLTLRRYLCLSLSYLASLAFIISIACVMLSVFQDSPQGAHILSQNTGFSVLVCVVLAFFVWQFVFVTLYSLFLLSIKSNMPTFGPADPGRDIKRIRAILEEHYKHDSFEGK